jgi:hypothetical protein
VPVEQFALPTGSAGTSTFEAEFVAKGTRWVYGFSCDTRAIQAEWLHQYGETNRLRTLYERKGDAFTFGRALPGNNKAVAGLTRPNSLFLSAAAQSDHEFLMPVWRWLSHLRFARPDDVQARQRFTVNRFMEEKYRDAILAALQAADFGIDNIAIEEEDAPENMKKVFEALSQVLPGESLPKAPEKTTKVTLLRKNSAGEVGSGIDFDEESLGTRAWFAALGPLVVSLSEGTLLCFDELESHLHPLLADQFIQAFCDPKINRKGAQLLFTTQRTFDMRSDSATGLSGLPLDRSQIWFTEKNADGETDLYPLTDFAPNKRQNLERAYLQGRYGAVPHVRLREALGELVGAR